jgi:predicted metal-binding membrane protein
MSSALPNRSIGLREAAWAWSTLLLLALLAWICTILQARAMGNGSGTMGMPVGAFLLMWIVMMAAMMFPAVAPVAILWSRGIALRASTLSHAWRIVLFVAGYLVAWSAIGLVAYFAFDAFGYALSRFPNSASYFGAGVFAAAGIFQFTRLKDICLQHCRSPLSALAHYTAFRGPAIDLRVGFHHGLYCGGCCWGLMLVLIVVGVMNIAIMAALTAVILLEKLSPRGPLLARMVGLVMLVLAALAFFAPQLFPGLRVCVCPNP